MGNSGSDPFTTYRSDFVDCGLSALKSGIAAKRETIALRSRYSRSATPKRFPETVVSFTREGVDHFKRAFAVAQRRDRDGKSEKGFGRRRREHLVAPYVSRNVVEPGCFD